MADLSRIGVAIDADLLAQFDRSIADCGYGSRSEAFRDVVRDALISQAASADETPVVGTITLVHDHHQRMLSDRLTEDRHAHHRARWLWGLGLLLLVAGPIALTAGAYHVSLADLVGLLVSGATPAPATNTHESVAAAVVWNLRMPRVLLPIVVGGALAASSGPPGEVRVEVRNTGSHLEPAALERIFDRFYRGDPARQRATGGTGLGLVIVKHLVEAHGGRVWARSDQDSVTVGFVLSCVPAEDSVGPADACHNA